MMVLPRPPRRAEQTAFWIVLCAGTGVVAGTLATLLAEPHWGAGAVAAWGAVATAGFLFRPLIAFTYRCWNRAALKVSRLAERVLLAGCYFVVFTGLRLARTGLSPGPEKKDAGRWHRRRTTPAESYLSQHVGSGVSSGTEGWLGAYASWSIGTGRAWALGLVPFLVLLSWVRAEGPREFPSNIYTLF